LKRPSRKLVTALILVIVFLVSYVAAFFVISFTPFGHISTRQYSNPQTFAVGDSNYSSSIGGAWQEQLLSVYPVGASNVPRDTSIVIVAPRPVRVFNISFSPSVTISKDNFVGSPWYSPPSSIQTIYPASLLAPNTTYNVTATVAGAQSWFTFTTSSGPSKLTFVYPLASYDTWVALTAAIMATSIALVELLFERKKA
jgi:hypothetical protein